MPDKYLHELSEFPDLLQIIENETGILAFLVEKDYWIMHVLYGLKAQNFQFELKGGTSLSKGFGIIDRFSEDIDIHIHPPQSLKVNGNPKNAKAQAVESRKNYYDWLSNNISIDGIVSVVRDEQFDDTDAYRSGGIRLLYNSHFQVVEGVKAGILLEAGFDTVTPNIARSIGSWALDRALETSGIKIIDNKAIDIACYHPGYTFVEKLQTIATKFRREQETGSYNQNFMRQYYDVYNLLAVDDVVNFIGTEEYYKHKHARFPEKDIVIPVHQNEAFLLSDPQKRKDYANRYAKTAHLYYKGQPPFDIILERINQFIGQL